MLKFKLLLAICLFTLMVHGQNEQNNWYFGRYAALNFDNGVAQAVFDNPQNLYGSSTTSISHPLTGKLLFYTNGENIWNGKHQQLANGSIPGTTASTQVIAMPIPGKSLMYYVFTVTTEKELQYTVIDMNQNNGDGAVVNHVTGTSNLNEYKFAIVKHKYAQAYWVITHSSLGTNSSFKAHYVDSNGVKPPVISKIGLAQNDYGDMVVSNQGNKLVVTHFSESVSNVEVFDFDPVCGFVTNQVILSKDPIWLHAYGIAFSPDDSKLYITFGYQLSQLVQYYGTNYQNNYLIASSQQNFNILRLGPDGRIYMTTHDNNIPGERINAITKPNEVAGACSFRETYLRLDEGAGKERTSSFELPKFATGKQVTNPQKDSIYTTTGGCLGDTSFFSFNTSNPFDSIRWFFGENNQTNHQAQSFYVYRKPGKYLIQLHIYRCGNTFPFSDTLIIDSIPNTFLHNDTAICSGLSLLLTGPKADSYLWSTGAGSNSINQTKTGYTWLTITKGKCKQTDSLLITNHPNPFITLSDTYYLCEDEEELVKLDAGEGFVNYKWTPTGDTTQWIIVKRTGEYFVQVIDHYGCPGNDQTKLRRRCGVLVHFPNAFSPNNDDINDRYSPAGRDVESFSMRVYNRWGEMIFESKHINQAWDGNVNGKPAPTDTYIYQATYSGYSNKRLITINTEGQFTLLR